MNVCSMIMGDKYEESYECLPVLTERCLYIVCEFK
jgi:hypothetical protein